MRLIESAETGHECMVVVTYAVVNYVLSLRGSEDVVSLTFRRPSKVGTKTIGIYFIVALLGKIKRRKYQKRSHLNPCANRISSGLEVKKIVGRLLKSRSNNLVLGRVQLFQIADLIWIR